MKAILGLYDASLGAQGNETSGKAIIARQKEGDVSTFHFIDNLSRAIEHGGRIMIDLIPTVYTEGRMVRVLGADMKTASSVQLGGPMPQIGEKGRIEQRPADLFAASGQAPMGAICDLGRGKYDLTVETGPSYGTRREEAAEQMSNLITAFPQAAPVLGDLIAKNLDWPDADEVAKRLQALLPPQLQGNGAPQDPMQSPQVQQLVQAGQQHIQEITQQAQGLAQENQTLQMQLTAAKQDQANKARELDIKAYEAETARIQAQKPEPLRAVA
jgi:hypothetical protein